MFPTIFLFMIADTDPILPAVEAFLAREGVSPTSFGKSAVNDPAFVHDLREGRELRKKTRDKVFAFLAHPKFPKRTPTEEARV
jgi:2,4-dienoyl-CoA reductase-like NADH-dependent reductase (Old Yellow Enzyme family)